MIDESKEEFKQICFKENCFNVKVVSTVHERERGLMDYESLGENEGMLFGFQEEGKHNFWMKNMSFPIDIIWINKNLEVVGFVENAIPCVGECSIYDSYQNSLYVLEINAGKIQELAINIEDKIILSK